MKLGIMQPYFFPYLGYFELINRTDKWVVFDSVQYIRHGWCNRNRIVHPSGAGWMYVTAPLQRFSQGTLIRDIKVQPGREWKQKVLRQLQHYKRKAPFFDEIYELVAKAIEPEDLSLARLNVNGIRLFCEYLGITFDYEVQSHMTLRLGPIEEPGDWALRISEAMGAGEYVNPPGGAGLFDESKFRAAGIRLTIQELVDFRYDCGPFEFTPCLSVIDACMWNGPHQIKAYLDTLALQRQAA